MQIIRATKTAEQAGAYYVRIQAMARKHQITLYAEFDEHDNKTHFYETMGYVADYSQKIVGETFTCYRMEKSLGYIHGDHGWTLETKTDKD